MSSLGIITAAVLLAIAGNACSAPTPSKPQAEAFAVELRARNDDGRPIAGATWTSDGHRLGETGPNGILPIILRGREGQLVQGTVGCPDGYVAPDVIPPVRLTHTRRVSPEQSQPITLEVVCVRLPRKVVLVVHAERGPALPVLVDGKAGGSTDLDGNAHVLLRVDHSVRTLDVALDSSGRADLVPPNPAQSFELDERDSLLVFTVTFSPSAKTSLKRTRPQYIP